VISVLRLLDLQGGTPAEYVSHEAAVSRIQMLHDNDGGGKVAGKSGQHLAQGPKTTNRGGKPYDIKSATGSG
jgi:hypothetical protein